MSLFSRLISKLIALGLELERVFYCNLALWEGLLLEKGLLLEQVVLEIGAVNTFFDRCQLFFWLLVP